MSSNAGFDYGRGVTNIDAKTGIRYGVISESSLPLWSEEAEPVYPEFTADEIRNGLEGGKYSAAELEAMDDDELQELASDWDVECTGTEYQKEGYEMHAGTDGFGIWVLRSPFYTLARFCSPCAPGAGDLDAIDADNGVKTFAPGHDWYESGHAPYPVYSVKTGARVLSDGAMVLPVFGGRSTVYSVFLPAKDGGRPVTWESKGGRRAWELEEHAVAVYVVEKVQAAVAVAS